MSLYTQTVAFVKKAEKEGISPKEICDGSGLGHRWFNKHFGKSAKGKSPDIYMIQKLHDYLLAKLSTRPKKKVA